MRVSTMPERQGSKHKVSLALETIRGASSEQVQQTIKMRSLLGVKKQHSMNQTDLFLKSRNSVHSLSPYTSKRHGWFFFQKCFMAYSSAS